VAFSSDVNALTLKLQLNTVVLPEILVVKIGASLTKMWFWTAYGCGRICGPQSMYELQSLSSAPWRVQC